LDSCGSSFEPAFIQRPLQSQSNNSRIVMDTPTNQLINGAFAEWEFNDTRCRLLRRYTDARPIGSGAQGLVM
jgi:hypothetical protein